MEWQIRNISMRFWRWHKKRRNHWWYQRLREEEHTRLTGLLRVLSKLQTLLRKDFTTLVSVLMLFVGQGIFPGVPFCSRVIYLCAWLIKNHGGHQITAASYDMVTRYSLSSLIRLCMLLYKFHFDHFLGTADRVQCAFCAGIIRNWDRGDIPKIQHKNFFNYCKMVQSA